MTGYIKRLQNKWILLTLAALVVLAGFVISHQSATARPQEDATIVLSAEDKPSGVSYLIGVDNQANEVIGQIDYDSTVTGIEQYRAFNNRELAKILESESATPVIPVKITFSLPLSQIEFTRFVEQYEIAVENYIIYMRESDGNIATIQGAPSGDMLVPDEFFSTATNSVAYEYDSGAEFLGWVEVSGSIQLETAAKMSKDQRVFMVDVLRVFMETLLTDQALSDAGIAKNVRRGLINDGFTEIYQKPLAWDLYHLGLMQVDTQ